MQDKGTHNVQEESSNNPLYELQNLVLGLNIDELHQLQSWLKSKDKFTSDVSRILPDAVIKSVERDEKLSDALLPVIETAIFNSVQKNPKALADALFPIMGPAIRQSISDTFRKMMQSLNDTLEKQFSTERLKWRLESIFSKKSYAEILLLKAMKFNVLSAMLIHKESGLLIQDAHSNSGDFDEADMISSMLKAVQDFVHDSFNKHIHDNDTLDTIKLNELNVWIIDGPFAFLAIVFDGDAPESKREFFKSKLETIHHKLGNELLNYNGEITKQTELQSILDDCIIDNRNKKAKKNNSKLLIVFSVILLLVLFWIGFSINKNIHESNFIDKLATYKSVVIIKQEKRKGKLIITAMKDVSMGNLHELAANYNLDSSEYSINWINYISTNNEFIISRFQQYLAPEKTIKMEFVKGVLTFTGEASSDWIKKAKDYCRINSGIFKTDFSQLEIVELKKIAAIKKEIEKINIKFENGVSLLNKYQKSQLDSLAVLIKQANSYTNIDSLNIDLYLDNKGSEYDNLRFAKSRKRHIISYLTSRGIDNIKSNIKKTNDSKIARTIDFKITTR